MTTTSASARPDAARSSTRLDSTSPPGLDRAPGWADQAELERFEDAISRYLTGDLDAEAFRRIRLWHGVYGQRQLTDVHMVRVKVPGGALTAADCLGYGQGHP